MKATIDQVLKKNKIMVIDGSMSTALELLGCDLNDSLWTAKILADQPELVKQVHLDYFRAGADCSITCSYQATIPGLMAKGYSQKEAEELITRSVKLFMEARDQWWQEEGEKNGRPYPLCLAGIGPYGAYLADGSEYRGNYGVSDEVLKNFHQRRAELLWQAGADILLFETQPSLHEALIEADIAEKLGADYWISFSCKDGSHIHEGNSLTECARALRDNHPHLKVIGVNCTAPQYISSLIGQLRQHTSLPIAVYPNSGETYDAVTKTWHGSQNGVTFESYARQWIADGASCIGGCCRTTSAHVRQVVAARNAAANK